MPEQELPRNSERWYVAVTLQIHGTASNWETVYTVVEESSSRTARGALRRGLKLLDHDDFWVCEVDGNDLRRILHSDLEPRPLDEDEFATVAEVIR